MDMSPQAYQQYVKLRAPRSPLLKNAALAFAVGGAICVAGQLILNCWLAAGLFSSVISGFPPVIIPKTHRKFRGTPVRNAFRPRRRACPLVAAGV